MKGILIATLFTLPFQAYFARSVEQGVARFLPAQGNVDLSTVYLNWISQASSRLDFCIYSINRWEVVDSLIAAHNRGVQVRIVADERAVDTTATAYFNALKNAGIPVIHNRVGLNRWNTGLMHHKFMIVDNAVVVTGSYNLSSAPQDANNVLVIQDTGLASIFRGEFEIMWGSSGPQPDTFAARFGSRKPFRPPRRVQVQGRPVYVLFFPDTTTDSLVRFLAHRMASAHTDVHLMQYWFSLGAYADSLRHAWDRGVLITALFDAGSYHSSCNSEAWTLEGDTTCAGSRAWSPPAWVAADAFTGILHHKVVLLDAETRGTTPAGTTAAVLTGSGNLTYSGTYANDEHLVLILDDTLTDQYLQALAARWQESTDPPSALIPGHADALQLQLTFSDSSTLAGRRVGFEGVVAAGAGTGFLLLRDLNQTGIWRGILAHTPSSLPRGTILHLHGVVQETLNTTVFTPETLWTAGQLSPPVPLTVSSLSTLMHEWYEGVWVRLPATTVRASRPDGAFQITDGSDSLWVALVGPRPWPPPGVGQTLDLYGALAESLNVWFFWLADSGGMVAVHESPPTSSRTLTPSSGFWMDPLGRRISHPPRRPGIWLQKGGSKRFLPPHLHP